MKSKFLVVMAVSSLIALGGISLPSSANVLIKTNTLQSLPVEECRIKEVSQSRGQTGAGFPAWNSLTPKTGKVKWALVPLQWTDLKGESNFRPAMNIQMNKLTDWYASVSQNRFQVEWVVHPNWVTLPGPSKDYKIPFSDSPDRSPEIAEFWKKAINAADSEFDFSGVQVVNFILPKKQEVVIETLQGFPWDKAVREHETSEGKVAAFSIAGKFFNQQGREYWSYWAHEFGHAIGLPHIGSSRKANEFHQYDLMGSQDGPTRELSGWLRFYGEWISDSQVYCQKIENLTSFNLNLVPLPSKSSGFKIAIIKISDQKALILESRRKTKFSCGPSLRSTGVLAYVYDAQLGHGEEFLVPLKPAGRKSTNISGCAVPKSTDHLLRKGNKVSYSGLTIQLIQSKETDTIKISR